MKKYLFYLFAIFLFTSCEKNNTDVLQDSGSFPVPAYPQPDDADAVLVAVRSSSASPAQLPSIPGMSDSGDDLIIDVGMGVAVFKDNAKADKVTLNGTDLKFENGVHVWMPDFSNFTDLSSLTGIDLGGSIVWDVKNPDINETLSSLPGTPKITSAKIITRSEGYSLTNNFASSSQKVLYAIYASADKYLLKEMDAGSTNCTFTAAELEELGTTKNGIIQANAYTITNKTLGGKKVYFVRQASYSLTSVTIN
ncbi:hypothetical protein SAMN05444274_108117 [Mariniphaga anaerophila]|uniref:Uncharacterized protein n=1 Tax=Mariniphaga anaerophila TaxID=1484053 RepID=A0A1M5E7L0_9BACT|nr:hypothetical protein [Mariniphaga anaerophila]SHF75176.1 hypothetical protein SAMN05444274_108117 [Mariniphaga anaerophila]